MGYFKDSEEVYHYIGGIFRVAGTHPQTASKLKAANVSLKLHLREPLASIVINFHDPFEVIEGPSDVEADVHFYAWADTADKFFRGDYNLAAGIAKNEIKAVGPFKKIVKLVPIARPLFPIYRDLTANKGRALVG